MINDDQCLYVFLRFHARFPISECLFELLSSFHLLPWSALVALIPPTSSSDSESDDASQKTWPAAPASVWQIQARLVMDDRSKRFVYITSFYRTAYLGKKETKYPKKHLKNMQLSSSRLMLSFGTLSCRRRVCSVFHGRSSLQTLMGLVRFEEKKQGRRSPVDLNKT